MPTSSTLSCECHTGGDCGNHERGQHNVCTLFRCNTATDALEFFGAQRTHDGKVGEVSMTATLDKSWFAPPLQGVTIPSQIRYVHYMEQVVHSAQLTFLSAPERRLMHVIMYTIPAFDSTGGCSEGAGLGVGPPCGLRFSPIPHCRSLLQNHLQWRCGVHFKSESEGGGLSAVTCTPTPLPCRGKMKGCQSCELASKQMCHGTAPFLSMAMCTLSFWTTTD